VIKYEYNNDGGERMATIRPSSDLRNRYNEISDFCNTYNEPVFITKNGTGDLVVLSNSEYERLCGLAELHRMLDAGLDDIQAGRVRSADEVFSDIERKLNLD
jgi:prevent-host-death family protein